MPGLPRTAGFGRGLRSMRGLPEELSHRGWNSGAAGRACKDRAVMLLTTEALEHLMMEEGGDQPVGDGERDEDSKCNQREHESPRGTFRLLWHNSFSLDRVHGARSDRVLGQHEAVR
jgi:hypothetical protein